MALKDVTLEPRVGVDPDLDLVSLEITRYSLIIETLSAGFLYPCQQCYICLSLTSKENIDQKANSLCTT